MQHPTYLISSMRNECPYILEFVSHYIVLGFNGIVIATNNNTDDTLDVLNRIESIGLIQVLENNISAGGQPQKEAYRKITRIIRARHENFIIYPADADELLFLYRHESIQDYLEFIGSADAIMLNWKFFGSNGHLKRPNGLVMEAYDRHGYPDHHGSRTLKSISCFTGNVRGFGIHFPHFVDLSRAQLRFGDGAFLPSENLLKRHLHQVWAEPHVDVAAIHHYGVKSYDEFAMKKSRGRGTGNLTVRHSDAYFKRYDRNDVKFEISSNWVARVRSKMEEIFDASGLGEHYDKSYFGI